MKQLSAWTRCFRPRLDVVHSPAAMIARNQIEREDSLGAGAVAIDIESNAHLEKQTLGGVLVAQEMSVGKRLDRLDQEPDMWPGFAAGFEHLIVKPWVSYSEKCMARSFELDGEALETTSKVVSRQ